jgi:AraC-like DNA-binding protein
MDIIDPFARIAVFGFFLLGASYMMVNELGKSRHGRLACLLVVCVAALALSGNPALLSNMGAVRWLWLLLGFATGVVYWLTAQAFFVDGFHVTKVHWALVTAVLVLSFGVEISPSQPQNLFSTGVAINLLTLLLVGHGISLVWFGHETDLDAARYQFRSQFAIQSAVYLLFSTGYVISRFLNLSSFEGSLKFLSFVVLSGITAQLAVLLHRYVSESAGKKWARQLEPVAGYRDSLTGGDAGLFDSLVELLEKRRVFIDDQLTIKALAEKLSTTPKTVRALIGGGYQFRNFDKFLNSFRVDAAKSYLGDVEEVHTALVDIAANVGFASTAALTREFSMIMGESPTEYRQRHVDENTSTVKLQLTNTDR